MWFHVVRAVRTTFVWVLVFQPRCSTGQSMAPRPVPPPKVEVAQDVNPPARAPRLLSPLNHMEITDVATFFHWTPVEDCSSYDLQIALDLDFQRIHKRKITKDVRYHRQRYFPKDILPPGAYFWRVRALIDSAPGPWSNVFSLKVNGDHAAAADVVRWIDARHPVFLMRSRAWAPHRYGNNVRDIIPPGLQRVIVVDDIRLAGDGGFERARKYQEMGVDFVIWNNRAQVPLPFIELLFQNFSHCIGTAEGEHFDSYGWERGPEGNISEWDYIHRAWALCAKYGRFYFIGDGDAGYRKWTVFTHDHADDLLRYRRNIVPMFKSTKGDLALHSIGSVQGLVVGGYVDNGGLWADEWTWPLSGFAELGEIDESQSMALRREYGTRLCPWIFDIQMWLVGIASGSTTFHLEAAHQWDKEGRGKKNKGCQLL